jgi:hypothetical protein
MIDKKGFWIDDYWNLFINKHHGLTQGKIMYVYKNVLIGSENIKIFGMFGMIDNDGFHNQPPTTVF